MKVKFWGVRGSRDAPGPHTLRYGGHTPCVAIETDSVLLVLDAGSGIVPLGESGIAPDKPIFVAVSHRHQDHTSGFPFSIHTGRYPSP